MSVYEEDDLDYFMDILKRHLEEHYPGLVVPSQELYARCKKAAIIFNRDDLDTTTAYETAMNTLLEGYPDTHDENADEADQQSHSSDHQRYAVHKKYFS